jgi:arylsulfatase B
MCSPSRTCLLGQYGRRFGIGRIILKTDANDLAPAPSLATALRSSGYSTAFVGKWHLSSGLNYDLNSAPGLFGFDSWRAVASHNPAATKVGGNYFDWGRIDDGIYTESLEYIPTAQAAAAVEWWNSTDGPKFLWLSFTSAHEPLHVPPAELYSGPVPITPRDQFEAMVEALDNRIAFFLDSIDRASTFVFFFSDNGTPDDSAESPPQQLGKLKRTLYEGGIGTPFFVQGPTVRAGETRRLVSSVDLFATILDLASSEISSPDSISFADELAPRSSTTLRPWIFAERFGPNGWSSSLPFPNTRERAISRADGWKLHVQEISGVEVSRELFDLVSDPDELAPVNSPAIEAELQTLLDLFP